jgi:HSP20 family protein
MSLLRFSTFDPVEGVLALQRALDRVFESPVGFDFGLSGRGLFPPMNAFRDKEGSLVIRLEVPGVSPDSLHIESQGRTLTISGRRDTAVPAGGSFHRRERATGEFARSLQLPEDLDAMKTDATYKHGVLVLHVPKREESKPRQISVQVH